MVRSRVWHSWKLWYEWTSEYIRINKIIRMNIQIYSYYFFYTNECPNKVFVLKIARIFEYSSRFYTITHSPTNVRIYSYKQIWHERMSEYIRKRKIYTNECPNIYSWPIYSNIRIFEYIRHTLKCTYVRLPLPDSCQVLFGEEPLLPVAVTEYWTVNWPSPLSSQHPETCNETQWRGVSAYICRLFWLIARTYFWGIKVSPLQYHLLDVCFADQHFQCSQGRPTELPPTEPHSKQRKSALEGSFPDGVLARADRSSRGKTTSDIF